MPISNADIDLGVWVSYRLALPLRVNGQLIHVDDDIG
jgi:hypothetical protein